MGGGGERERVRSCGRACVCDCVIVCDCVCEYVQAVQQGGRSVREVTRYFRVFWILEFRLEKSSLSFWFRLATTSRRSAASQRASRTPSANISAVVLAE